jgi:hypothetical protein
MQCPVNFTFDHRAVPCGAAQGLAKGGAALFFAESTFFR